MATGETIEDYNGYIIYGNVYGMYYINELIDGYFKKMVFDDIDILKNYIDAITGGAKKYE